MDKEQFWTLLEPVHAQAEAYCRRLTGCRDDGDDLYQESLLTAMRKFGTIREMSSFRSWLFRIIVNSFKNRNKQPWWRRRTEMAPESIEVESGGDPRGQLDSTRWLERAMAALSAEDRAMIVLFEIEGYPVAELASIFGKPEGTIKARLFRARKKMRERIERYLSKTETKNSASEAEYGEAEIALQRSNPADR
ncbi:MAG: hypothetical protein DRP46_13715 [Candidatus Zixiibacteriota bacterium]|nr:MAG: hypothetical protein DRP46_13715 [candidate division Zixibacteria bacterium]